jgi:hypothetical protein
MWACLDADWHTVEVLKLQMGQLNKEENESYNREDQIKLFFYLIHKISYFLVSQRATDGFINFQRALSIFPVIRGMKCVKKNFVSKIAIK